jgi:hypothetical protein
VVECYSHHISLRLVVLSIVGWVLGFSPHVFDS